jgi:VIT1/CCC1 family predicted Fe2+/Mn2+ transporter
MKTPAPVDYLRRSRIAFAVAVICGLFITETLSAHRVNPSPASPFIWAALGSVGAAALVYAVWCKLKLRDAGTDKSA